MRPSSFLNYLITKILAYSIFRLVQLLIIAIYISTKSLFFFLKKLHSLRLLLN